VRLCVCVCVRRWLVLISDEVSTLVPDPLRCVCVGGFSCIRGSPVLGGSLLCVCVGGGFSGCSAQRAHCCILALVLI